MQKRRNKIRLISFISAAVMILVGSSVLNFNRARLAERRLEAVYLCSVQELSNAVGAISVAIEKEIYSNSPERLEALASLMETKSATAKTALASLPIEQQGLDSSYKFLSQVGNYALSLAHKATDGQTLTQAEGENLLALMEYSYYFADYISALEHKIRASDGDTAQAIADYFEDHPEEAIAAEVYQTVDALSDEMAEQQSDVATMPKLIYDGPFSDHILSKSPAHTENLAPVEMADALKLAEAVANTDVGALEFTQMENSLMELFCFDDSEGEIEVGITENGGVPAYMTNSRTPELSKIAPEQAVAKAEQYLHDIGFANMQRTYFEINGNICTINFASYEDDIIYYTDLIKVSVAMDNADLLMLDARGYISNHHKRTPTAPTLTAQEAAKNLSPLLTMRSHRLAVIPTSGQNEVLCHEFHCLTKDRTPVLVYINPENGQEEDLLLLKVSESGEVVV